MMMNIRKNLPCALMALVMLASLVGLSQPVAAQQGGATRYVYDQNGRLRAVISPNGEAAVYDYDPAGNFTAIRRLGTNACEALEFSPRQGPFGAKVTVYGVGFKGEVSAVSFNGVAAKIGPQTPASVIAEVPSGATTGPITVTAPCGTLTLRPDFTVSGVQATILAQGDVNIGGYILVDGQPGAVHKGSPGGPGGFRGGEGWLRPVRSIRACSIQADFRRSY